MPLLTIKQPSPLLKANPLCLFKLLQVYRSERSPHSSNNDPLSSEKLKRKLKNFWALLIFFCRSQYLEFIDTSPLCHVFIFCIQVRFKKHHSSSTFCYNWVFWWIVFHSTSTSCMFSLCSVLFYLSVYYFFFFAIINGAWSFHFEGQMCLKWTSHVVVLVEVWKFIWTHRSWRRQRQFFCSKLWKCVRLTRGLKQASKSFI